MGTSKWVTVKKQWCEILQGEAELLEHRVYPDTVLPDTEPFRVIARKCSAAIACNLIGCQCKWAYTNADVDRFG